MPVRFTDGFSAHSPSKPTHVLPGSRPALMVTWGVGETFGGMTAMCLKRAALFHERGVPSAVVTFDPAANFQTVQRIHRESGRLHPEVPLLNLHEYYAARVILGAQGQSQNPLVPDESLVLLTSVHRDVDNSVLYNEYQAAGNSAHTVRHYLRQDGSVYLTDTKRPNLKTPKTITRRLELIDASGATFSTFSSASELYRHWLAELVEQGPTDLIVDSKTSARFISDFEHPNAVKIYNFHSTHIVAGADALSGNLTAHHAPLIEKSEKWDALTFLTESQRNIFVQRFGTSTYTQVIGNPVDGPEICPAFENRNRNKVVHIGRLTAGKNIGEVIEVVRAVAEKGIPVTLDLIGDGVQRAALEEQVNAAGMNHIVTFRGHVDTVAQELAEASVLLLCSKFEGQSLAILEAQASACVPVAYDVNFGPRDVITKDLNGFLVPFMDRERAADAVARLLTDDRLFQSMSAKAFEISKEHTSDAIFAQWIKQLDIAWENRDRRGLWNQITATLSQISFRNDGTVEIEIATKLHGLELSGLQLLVSERGSATQEPIIGDPYSGQDETFKFIVPADMRKKIPGKEPLDVQVRLEVQEFAKVFRLGIGSKPTAFPFLTGFGNLSFK